jgi:hypothetical protein
MQQLPEEFFTVESMATLVGASGATFVIANGVQAALGFNPRWFALAVAQVICLVGVYAAHSAADAATPVDYFVGVVNGFLVYWTAAGATAMGRRRADGSADDAVAHGLEVPPERGSGRGSRRRRSFLTPWF